ncbi:MAG: hypothetical protein J6Q64_00695, partial [Clostridia bacterium]|nr:hypothetical protein [Clostridia bacterium]
SLLLSIRVRAIAYSFFAVLPSLYHENRESSRENKKKRKKFLEAAECRFFRFSQIASNGVKRRVFEKYIDNECKCLV